MMTPVILLVLLGALTSSVDAGSCYAPPFFFGSTCQSTGIFGHPGYQLGYSVTVTGNAGTLVCCQGRACGNSGCYMTSIGCSHSKITATVPWGNNLAMAAIKCKGTPTGAFVSFSP